MKAYEVVLIAAAVAGAFVLYGLDGNRNGNLPPLTESEIAQKTVDVDLSYYTREQYPKTYLALGETAVRGELQSLRRAAARQAASYRECDKVALSDYSQNRSTISNIVVFADCENGFRVYFDKSGVIEKKQF